MDWIVYCGGLVFAFYLIAFFAFLRKDVPVELKAKKLTTKPASQATVKPQATVKSQAPTEEELLLAMSNTELLREIVRNQRQMLVVMNSTNRRSGLGLLGFLNVFRLLSDDNE